MILPQVHFQVYKFFLIIAALFEVLLGLFVSLFFGGREGGGVGKKNIKI